MFSDGIVQIHKKEDGKMKKRKRSIVCHHLEHNTKNKTQTAIGFLAAFVLWTVSVSIIDVAPIGPLNSEVGFSTLNGFIHELSGVNLQLYILTDLLGFVPIAVALCFAVIGLMQWIKRKSILKVDRDILALGVFYAVVLAVFCFFEMFVINYRPVLIDGVLEVSYPSSTTLLVTCVMPTSVMEIKRKLPPSALRRLAELGAWAFTLFMVSARLISGVHWFSDIIGGSLLSVGLVLTYSLFLTKKHTRTETQGISK